MRFAGVRGVLFDLDGVLVDSYDVWSHLLNHTARDFGAPPIDRETFAACWGQGVEADVRRFFPGRSIEETEAHYHAHFMDHAAHLRVEPDAARVIEELRSARLATALITNTPSPLARSILAHAGIAIDTVVGGTDVPASKPAPDMVLEACRRLGLPPEAAVVVGDSEYDARAAAAARVRFVGFRRPGDASVEQLADLTRLLLAHAEGVSGTS